MDDNLCKLFEQHLDIQDEMEKLSKLADHYLAMETFWANRWGANSSEARSYADLRQAINTRLIDLMIAEANHGA